LAEDIGAGTTRFGSTAGSQLQSSQSTTIKNIPAVAPPVVRNDVENGASHHEIGLVPLTSGATKYIGTSSGFTIAKLVFAKANSAGESPGTHRSGSSPTSLSKVQSRLLAKIAPSSLPETCEEALQLSSYYFDHVHVHCSFLHEPSYALLLRKFYEGEELSAAGHFQLAMVLAISAHYCGRRLRLPYSGDGLCARAMLKFDFIDFQNSLEGVQCLLLIVMFTWYSPYLEVNPWYLNYQCLAACVDLGLQRDVPTSSSCSVFEREMRTRAFWSIYAIDRNLATRLGRPIGLRDEGCELRLPADLEDNDLDVNMVSIPVVSSTPPGVLACSRILIRLTLLNSEAKYILHSITTDLPRYTYPQIPDLKAWQRDFHNRLQQIVAETPQLAENQIHLMEACQLRYHELVMLLFRPSPRFRKPTKAALLECQKSAEAQLRLFRKKYDSDELPFSWASIHAICLAAITLLYSIWSEPSIAAVVRIDQLMDDLRSASNLLSAIGEYWPEARRTRANLEQLSSSTIRWLLDLHSSNRIQSTAQSNSHRSSAIDRAVNTPAAIDTQLPELGEMPMDWDWPAIDAYLDNENLATFVGAPDPFTADFSLTIDGLWSDYQPTFDFGS
jgi:hypothetical protein